MHSLLLVSDNPELTQFFQLEVAHQQLTDEVGFEFAYSPSNSKPIQMQELGATPVDVADAEFIASAKDTYKLILSIHCKQIFPPSLVESITCLNLHPGLNPFNRGWYPQVFSIINGKPVGATLHVMDVDIDHGPIIAQREVPIFSADTSLDVYVRIIDAEKLLLREHLADIVAGTFEAELSVDNGNYNSISDFRDLSALDLEAVGTLREHIDLLRALTHGEFDNAWFIDEDGEKVFVKIFFKKNS